MNVPHDALFQIAQMVPLHQTGGLQELQVKKSLNHWSKFKLISQNCSSVNALPKLHKWFSFAEQKDCQSSR